MAKGKARGTIRLEIKNKMLAASFCPAASSTALSLPLVAVQM